MNQQQTALSRSLEGSIRLDERAKALREIAQLVGKYKDARFNGNDKCWDAATRAAAEDILSDLNEMLNAAERLADDNDAE